MEKSWIFKKKKCSQTPCKKTKCLASTSLPHSFPPFGSILKKHSLYRIKYQLSKSYFPNFETYCFQYFSTASPTLIRVIFEKVDLRCVIKSKGEKVVKKWFLKKKIHVDTACTCINECRMRPSSSSRPKSCETFGCSYRTDIADRKSCVLTMLSDRNN